MVTPVISYSVDNDRRFANALARARGALGDLRAPFSLILNDFYKSEQAIFKLQSAGKYPDFTEDGAEVGANSRYAKLKEKKVGFKYPLLVRTGKLAASLLSAGAAGAIASISRTELIIGTTIDYGIYHQSDAPRKKIPLRKFLFIGPESTFASSEQAGRPERWMNILNDHVLAAQRASGAFK